MRLNPFRKKPVKRKRGRPPANPEKETWLTPHARKAVFGIVLLVFTMILLLSFFNAAGPMGELIFDLARRTFGWLVYFTPLASLALVGYLLWPQRFGMERLRFIGLLLIIVGLLGFLHAVSTSLELSLDFADAGKGGGYIGFLLSFFIGQAVSRIATAGIFLAAFLIGLILVFRLSPADIWEWFTDRLEARRMDAEEGADDEEMDEEGLDEEDADEEEAGDEQKRFKVGAIRGGRNAAPAPVSAQSAHVVKVSTKRYRPPILKLLNESSSATAHNRELEETNKETIRRTLETFGIAVGMDDTNVGPTVTQYTLRPEEGTKLTRITALQDDLALALAAHPLRIEAPIPNTNLVGIEIPNKEASLVGLRELLSSKEFKKHESPLAFPLGRSVGGDVVVDTLERLPHMLIAGATGSGKSVNVHTLLISWLYRNSPDSVRFILIDPKRVELKTYNDIPHLLTPVIVDPEKTINALKWAIDEMDVRYRLLEEAGARNLHSFNANNPDEAKPLIVIVIDELGDLMVKHAREIEGPIVRLSQMARAVGIHLVLATQRPSVNVITGLIKANVPARIAFSVASQIDSRTILDMAGAEKLVGRGDMLYMSGDKARPIRIQGGFVTEEEVADVVAAVREAGEPDYNEAVVASSGGSSGGGGDSDDNGSDDPLYEDAKELVIKTEKASASFLQRRLRIGYARAARLLDVLEDNGIIGPAMGNKPREILAGDEEAESLTVAVSADDAADPLTDDGDDEFAMPDDDEDEEDYSSKSEW